MTLARPGWAVVRGAAGWIVAARALSAQVGGTVDLGVSTVHYDHYAPSGAASLSSGVVIERPRSTFSLRAAALAFESGNTSVQGSLAGSAFARAVGPWRAEVWGTAGASRYATFADFWHALGGVRIHVLGRRASWWVDGSAGRTSFGQAPRPVAAAGGGVWTRRGATTFTLSASYTRVGDIVYTDVGTLARRRDGRIDLEGALATRFWSRGGGRGVFGEASAAVDVSPRAALVLAGGRYPTDPVRGSISGRYLTVALRLRWRPAPPAPPRYPPSRPSFASTSHSSPVSEATAQLDVLPLDDGDVRLLVRAPAATVVEIIGDFTDWQPLALARGMDGAWEAIVRISSGVHRICVRVDGGAWIVPAGTRAADDDFDGAVGIFVVP